MKGKKIFSVVLLGVMLFSFWVAPVSSEASPEENGYNDCENKTVLIGGQTVGVALYTDGLFVSDLVELTSDRGEKRNPGEEAGLKAGDYLLSANGTALQDISNLDAVLSASGGKALHLTVKRRDRTFTTDIVPVKCANDAGFRLGLWLRDSAAGLGTVTMVDPDTHRFYALGHSIADAADPLPLTLRCGRLVSCRLTGVQPGKKGAPGELKGTFGINAGFLGTIEKNTRFGLTGIADNALCRGEKTAIAPSSAVHEGDAEIRCTIENQQTKNYRIKILKVNHQSTPDEKSMIIKVTDPELLNKTGGVVQGMSGSPILQDGRLIGAVTHVMISDPTRGYGIFIEWMMTG